MIKSAGKIVYDTDNLHNVTFVKNLLEYSDDYSRSVGKNSLWYLDTDNTTDDTNLGFEYVLLLTALYIYALPCIEHSNWLDRHLFLIIYIYIYVFI